MRVLQDDNGIFNLIKVILITILVSVSLYITVFDLPYIQLISFRWYQGAGFAVIALMAQMFFKLNDTREQSKISEVAFDKLQNKIEAKSTILLRVIIFYFISLIMSVIIISIADSGQVDVFFSKLFKIISLAYLPAWTLSVINSYQVYQDISEYKAELALIELQKNKRRNAVDRLNSKH